MHGFKTTALAGALWLAFASPAAHAQSNAQLKKEIEELRKQVQLLVANPKPATTIENAKEMAELRQQIRELHDQLKAQADEKTKATAAATPAADADQATVDAATPATKADIQGVRADFENYKYETARTLERKVPSVTRNTVIGGTLQARATWQNPAQNAGVANGANAGNTTYQATPRHTSFDIPAVTLSFAGTLYRDYGEGKNLSYALGFSTASNTAGAPNATAGSLPVTSPNGSQVNLTNAYLSYSLFPTNGGQEDPKGAVAFGQQLVPFGLEAQTNDEIRPVINSAQFTSLMSGINVRQIGLVYRGDSFVNVDYTNNYRSTLLEYALGVVNGSGPNKSDNNGKKDWIGRLAVTLPADYNSWLRELKLGTSYYFGYNNLANTTSNAVVQLSNSRRIGFDINYTHLPFSIAYEYAGGYDDALDGAAGTATALTPNYVKKSRGQYINFGYTWGEQFLASEKSLAKYDDYWPKTYQAFVRFDTFDADTLNNAGRPSSLGDETFITTLGLNTFFAETTKLQMNYLVARNDAPANGIYTANRPRKTQAVQVQFQYGF